MATCREVITRAFRRLGVFASGEDPPAENEADGLACLKGLLTGAISHSAQKGLARVLISAAYTANENELVAADENGPYTITLPTTITECGAERAPKDLSVVMVAGATPQAWLYEDSYGDWIEVTGLVLSDYCPLSNYDSEGLTAALAGYMADEYGRPITPLLAGFAQRGKDWLYGKLRKPVRVVVDAPLLRANRSWR